MISWQDFEKIDIRTGTILSVDLFPEAIKPAYQLLIDFGELGIKKSSAQITAHQHKPFNPFTQQHQQFLHKYASVTQRLMEQYPYLKLEAELDYFRKGVRNPEQADSSELIQD